MPTPYFEDTYPTLILVLLSFSNSEEVAGKFGLQCISEEKLLPQEKNILLMTCIQILRVPTHSKKSV